MSSLALMRLLEATPGRYDAGMRALTLGRVTRLHDAVAAASVQRPRARVLEIGCGTGAVTERLVGAGARVTALDASPEMLEQAGARLGRAGAAEPEGEKVTWLEQTAAEIDRLPAAGYDAVVLSLCLSDMSTSERAYVLRECVARLAPGGRVVAADEVRAPGLRGVLQRLGRLPLAALGWLLVGSVSSPLADLEGELRAAGFVPCDEEHWLAGTLALYVAEPAP